MSDNHDPANTDDIEDAINDLRAEFEEQIESLADKFKQELQWAKDDWEAEKDALDDKIYDLECKVEEYRRELGEQD